jgi:hypothetical protein
MSVSKIQAAFSHPSLLTACQMALAVSSGLCKNLCGQWSRHSLQNALLPTRKTFGMKSQKEGGFGPPRAVTPWKKKKLYRISESDIIRKAVLRTQSSLQPCAQQSGRPRSRWFERTVVSDPTGRVCRLLAAAAGECYRALLPLWRDCSVPLIVCDSRAACCT